MTSGMRLRHLAYWGPGAEPAVITFGPGLNVIYGASDTGKSFVQKSIDFMLGGGRELPDIPERIGYDRVFLGIESLVSGDTFTLRRSTSGGRFLLYPGLHETEPPEGVEPKELADTHSDRNSSNVSTFLLDQCGIGSNKIRKNKAGETVNLTFRFLARLVTVSETDVTAERSPLSDGTLVSETANFSAFKYLLTGVDDSALISTRQAIAEDQTREAQLKLLDEIIKDYRSRVREYTSTPSELREQQASLESAMQDRMDRLRETEDQYRALVQDRRKLRERVESGQDRAAEIDGLIQRFALLEAHYRSDVARLTAIAEAGNLFVALGESICPLCGAEAAHHQNHCEADIEAVAEAARAEIAKIGVLQSDLRETVAALRTEAQSFARQLPRLEERLNAINLQLERSVSPDLTRRRAGYSELSDKYAEVREAIIVLEALHDFESRKRGLERAADLEESNLGNGALPSATADEFAQYVLAILSDWHFPGADRAHFDTKARDLVIDGKLRTARGKGLRAITHAAFTVGLMLFCSIKVLKHPGFVTIDSALLSYREPEGDEDDLRGTDLAECFYRFLLEMPQDCQAIIIENTDPPESVMPLPQATFFTRNPHKGRFGFFPQQGA